MNILSFLIARFLKRGKYGKALALVPLLGKMSFREFIWNLRRLSSYLFSGKASKKEIALLMAAVAYLIWPMDILPEFFPLLGVLDDVAIVTVVLGYLHRKAIESELSKPINT